MAVTSEIEVKLTGSPSELSAAFANLQGTHPTRATLLTTYYDTPDGRLQRNGFALRVREQNGARELTLKQDHGDGLTRAEWSASLEAPRGRDDRPDPGLLPSRTPRAALGIEDAAALEPAFITDFERRKKEIRAGDAVVEVALDLGRIVAGERQEPLAELEFELLGGPVGDMLQGVRSVLCERSLCIGTRSKAARGMDLSRGVPPSAVKATPAHLAPSNTIDAALASVCRVSSIQTLGNIAPILEVGDPEGVHQLRVSLRRLRSALLFFKDHVGPSAKALNKEARRALRRLGPARDLDVFLLETLPAVAAANPCEPSLARLREAAEARRSRACADVHRLIRSRRFNCFLLDLVAAAESGGLVVTGTAEPLPSAARHRLARRHRRLMKLAGGFDQLTPPERHRVRLALKKLRYACDYSRGLFPGSATRDYLKRLSRLQDDLGHLNDAVVARKISTRMAADDPDAASGASLVGAWCIERARMVEPGLRRAWRQLTETAPFWLAPPSGGATATD